MVDITQYLSDCKFILVSNREPYEHVRGGTADDNGTSARFNVKQPAGGLVTALEAFLHAGHWPKMSSFPARLPLPCFSRMPISSRNQTGLIPQIS